MLLILHYYHWHHPTDTIQRTEEKSPKPRSSCCSGMIKFGNTRSSMLEGHLVSPEQKIVCFLPHMRTGNIWTTFAPYLPKRKQQLFTRIIFWCEILIIIYVKYWSSSMCTRTQHHVLTFQTSMMTPHGSAHRRSFKPTKEERMLS